MSEKRILKALNSFGLTKNDAVIYIFLAKRGTHKIRDIASVLNLTESNIHKSLKDLLNRKLVKTSSEYPLGFVAVPFEQVIKLIIEVKKEQAKSLQASKEELLSTWRSITEKASSKTFILGQKKKGKELL